MAQSLNQANAIYLRLQGRQCGPLLQDQVKALVRQGTAAMEDFVSVDGGETWVALGKTSLVASLPVKRVQGRVQAPVMPDRIALNFDEAVRALPPAPRQWEQAGPSVVVQVPAKKPWGWVVGAGAIGLALGCGIGFGMGRSAAPTPDAQSVAPNGPALVESPASVLQLAEIDRSLFDRVVTVEVALGAPEAEVDPVQLPGLSDHCLLARVQARQHSLQVAVRMAEAGDAKANRLRVSADDMVGAAKKNLWFDAEGKPVPEGASVFLTGQVRFKAEDKEQLYPILEVKEIKRVAGRK